MCLCKSLRDTKVHHVFYCSKLFPFLVAAGHIQTKFKLQDMQKEYQPWSHLTKCLRAHQWNFVEQNPFVPILILMTESGYSSAHVTTAEILWYVQSCGLIYHCFLLKRTSNLALMELVPGLILMDITISFEKWRKQFRNMAGIYT